MSDSYQKFKLGKDQLKWLEKYKSINLNEWRVGPNSHNSELVKTKSNTLSNLWMYIGDWKVNENKSDGGYLERRYNLENDRYFYWPKE